MFDLSEIADFCREAGVKCARHDDELRVELTQSAMLCFANLVAESDTLIGFRDVPTHTHNSWTIMTGADSYLELGPIELLKGWLAGDLLICSSELNGNLRDRWLVHRLDRPRLEHMDLGERLIFERKPNQSQNST